MPTSTIKFTSPKQHAGQIYAVGSQITIDSSTADMYVADGVAVFVSKAVLNDGNVPISLDPASGAAGAYRGTYWAVANGYAPKGTKTSDIQAAINAAISDGVPMVVLSPFVTYTYDTPITLNIAKCGLVGQATAIDCSAMTASAGPALTIDYSFAGAAGWQKQANKTHPLEGFRLTGPGKGVAGCSAIYVNGTNASPSLGARPTMRDILLTDFEVLLDGKDRFFLTQMYSVELYAAKIGIRQQAGTDAGENCAMFGCTMSSIDLCFHLLDGSSEWFLSGGTSIDYVNQLCVMQGSPSRLVLSDCHVEPRGANAGDGNYVLDGSGADARAVVAGRDSFIDIDGNGSLFLMKGSWWDINNSGGAGPYAFQNLVNLRHKNARATFRDNSMQNMANTANCFWTGIGKCIVTNTHFQDNPSMPSRISDQAFGNALRDGGVEDSTLEDLWYISKDTATITSRTTGTNISIARSTTQKRSGSSSLAVTKVASGSGQISVLIPVTPGEKLSVFGYLYNPSASGITGAVYADIRWANVLGLDSNGVPIISSSSGVAFHASVTPTIAPTNTWNSFAIKTYDNGASGEPCAPAWATHLRLTLNCDSMSAAGTFYIDDLAVSRW